MNRCFGNRSCHQLPHVPRSNNPPLSLAGAWSCMGPTQTFTPSCGEMCGVLCGPADPDQRLPCAYSRIWPLFTCFISFPPVFFKTAENSKCQGSGLRKRSTETRVWVFRHVKAGVLSLPCGPTGPTCRKRRKLKPKYEMLAVQPSVLYPDVEVEAGTGPSLVSSWPP